LTKYDPAHRDARGYYTGPEDIVSDHGPVEAAYLSAVSALAEASGIDHLEVREPELPGLAHFGLEPTIEGYGLDGLLDPADFHDGARVTLPTALELVRAMLRDHGLWCRLEAEGRFAVHVGRDQYLYVGSALPCESALESIDGLGLFAEPIDFSPYDASLDAGPDELGRQRPADDSFWDRLRLCVSRNQAGLLQEQYAGNASRWHRLAEDTLEELRTRLTPRSRLAVWPGLSEDVDAVLAGLPEEWLTEVVWEDPHGHVTSVTVDEDDHAELARLLTGARGALALSVYQDEDPPLFTGVLPDADGVLRARWRTDPSPGDEIWRRLTELRRGQIVTGTVVEIADFWVTFVDIGGFIAMINVPELSWRPFAHPSEIVSVGEEVRAEVLDIELAWERVPLSLKSLTEDPMVPLVARAGEVVTGTVTKILPFGVFVRIEDRRDGFEGLVHESVPAETVPEVGDLLTVRILEVDPRRRRITLSPADPVG
jgi:small subunit ribosomal protein S1